MKRVLDSQDGVTSIFHHDDQANLSHVQRIQDCEAIVENNKALQTDGTRGDFQGKWGRRIASIPLVVAEKWIKEDGINWLALPKKERRAYLRRKLNDPEYRYLRTSPGQF